MKFDDLKNAKQINDWVKTKTNNKKANMVNNLNPLVVMVILNAIYFHDEWVEAFDPKKTSSKPFYLSNHKEKKVNMMHKKFNKAKYFGNDKYQAINLPYKNSNISATIVLPGVKTALKDFIRNMSTGLFFSLFEGMSTEEVELYLPRIKLEKSYELKDILTNLGLKEAFQNKADFSSLTEEKPFFINQINHKIFFEMDEKGTTGAVASDASMNLALPMNGNIVMNCNRPYLVFLTKYCPVIKKILILFCAKIENP